MGCASGTLRFAWRRLGQNGVVFDRRYGDTHTLSGVTANIFDAWLSCGSVVIDDLIAELAVGDTQSIPDRMALNNALLELQQRQLLPLR